MNRSPALCRTIRCAIHVHTRYGRVGKPVADIVRLAADAGVECLIITDHNSVAAADDGWEGRHGGVLVAVGSEIRSGDGFDILGLGARVRVASRRLTRDECLSLMDRLGMRRFAAHPQGIRSWLTGRRRGRWDPIPERRLLDGLEIWNYMVDWNATLSPWRLNRMCRTPGAFLRGPEPEILAAWDALAAEGPMAGIGSQDAHAIDPGFFAGLIFPAARGGILPYERGFRDFAHYALVPAANWGSSDILDIRAVVDSLAHGNGWFCREDLACGRGFSFTGISGDETCAPGGALPAAPDAKLAVCVPHAADIRIVRNGTTHMESQGTECRCTATETGAYRVECRIDGRMWLVSNHIHMTGTAGRRDPGTVPPEESPDASFRPFAAKFA